jgi:hypothetical protein
MVLMFLLICLPDLMDHVFVNRATFPSVDSRPRPVAPEQPCCLLTHVYAGTADFASSSTLSMRSSSPAPHVFLPCPTRSRLAAASAAAFQQRPAPSALDCPGTYLPDLFPVIPVSCFRPTRIRQNSSLYAGPARQSSLSSARSSGSPPYLDSIPSTSHGMPQPAIFFMTATPHLMGDTLLFSAAIRVSPCVIPSLLLPPPAAGLLGPCWHRLAHVHRAPDCCADPYIYIYIYICRPVASSPVCHHRPSVTRIHPGCRRCSRR